jgi:translation initiation factor IF-1
MAKEENKERQFNGQVVAALPNTMFRVELEDGRSVLTTLTGRMRRTYTRVMPGDRVKIELTPYEEDKGRIIYKY